MKNEPLIAAIRRTCGTQAELARRMGKSRQNIYKLVRGGNPKISEVNRLARARSRRRTRWTTLACLTQRKTSR